MIDWLVISEFVVGFLIADIIWENIKFVLQRNSRKKLELEIEKLKLEIKILELKKDE